MKHHRPRPGTAVAGNVLALTALAAGISQAPAVFGAEVAPRTEQVAVADETGEQFPISSEGSGSGQLASADGTRIVFATNAPLVSADDNEASDVYLRDTVAGTTTLISQHDGVPGDDYSWNPTISNDGTRVAFLTMATDLTDRRDRNRHTPDALVTVVDSNKFVLVSQTTAGFQRDGHTTNAVISGNGKVVAFQTIASFDRRDDDNREDVYVRRLGRERTVQVSLLPGSGEDVRGHVLVGDVTDDGRKVTFGNANNLWVRDVAAAETARFWQEPDSPPCTHHNPQGSAGRPAISGDGRYAAFSSCALDLPGEDGQATDVYRIDLETGAIGRVGVAGDHDSYIPSLSRTGRYVAFGSDATTLVGGDVEAQPDAFWADVETGQVVRVSQTPDGTGGNSWNATTVVSINADGQTVTYGSYSDNLVEGDLFDEREILAWHR